MKKNIIKILLCIIILVVFVGITSYAATSDVFNNAYYNTYAKAYGSGLLAPNVVSNDDLVDVTRGEVIVDETDYTIMTKGGFGIPVIRSHSVDISKGYSQEYYYSTKQTFVRYIGYHYIDTSTGISIIIAFRTEFDAYKYGKTFVGRSKSYLDSFSNVLKSDGKNKYYLAENVINQSNSNTTYILDETKPPVYLTNTSNYLNKIREIITSKHQLKIGEGWIVKKPGIALQDNIIYDEDFYSIFTFQDIHGRAYHAQASFERLSGDIYAYKDLSNAGVNPLLITMSFVNPDNITTYSTHPAGFVYNAIITSDFGEKYYFYATAYNVYNIVAISDKHDNIVHVDATSGNFITYTDDNGVEYRVSASGIVRTKNDVAITLVSYDFSYVNSNEDSGDYFDCDDIAQFTLKRITDENQDISLSEDVTVYSAKQILCFNSILDLAGADDKAYYIVGCYITDIDYPAGVRKKYEYEYYDDDRSTLVSIYRVSRFNELYNDVVYNLRTFTYDQIVRYSSVQYPCLTLVTHYKNQTNSSALTESYYIDEYGRVALKSTSYGGTYKYIDNTYTYKSSAYNAPVVTDKVTFNGSTGTVTNNYSYNSGNLLTQNSADGKIFEKTEYGKYNIVTSQYKYRDGTNYIRQLNTLTPDGISVAKTQMFDNAELKSQISYTYDTYGNVTSETVMLTDETSYTVTYDHTYNSDGDRTTVTTVSGIKDADNSVMSDATMAVTADIYGNILSETDAKGNTTTYEYDIQHRLTKVTYPDNTTNVYAYDIVNNIIDVTDAKGNKMRYKYDPWGKLAEVGYYESNTYNILEKYIYDFRHNLTEYRKYSDDDTYVKATYTYNSFNKVLTEQVYNESGTEIRKTEYTYSFNDSKIATTTTAKISGGGRTFAVNERKADYFGRLMYEKQTASNSTSRQYNYTTDFLGNILSVTKPDNSVERYVYGHLGNVTSFTNAAGDTMHYAYDMAGNNISVTDFNGNTTNYVYDILGRQIKTVAPFSETATSTTKTYYDVNGNVIKTAVQNNAEGDSESYRTIDYAYDNMNRLSYTIEHPDSTTNEYTQYFYDANGNVTNTVKGLTAPISSFASRPSTSRYLTYTYDVLSRNTGISGTLTASVKGYIYDRSGNVTAYTNGGNTVNYTYDPFGNVLTIQGGTDASKYITYTYNALGLRTKMVDETGTTNYVYNDFGELTSETKGGIIKTSGYNNMGMRTSFAVTSDGSSILSNTYVYDNLGRMTSVTQSGDTVSYTYDKNGNLLQRTVKGIPAVYTYNKANLRISDAIGVPTDNVQYTYYLDGNKKSRINSFLQNEYEYDNKSRLISSSFVFDTFEATYESFEYDAYDDLRKKIVRVIDSYGYEPVERNFETFYDYYPETRLWLQDDLEIINGKNTLLSYSDTYYDENGNISRKESYDASHNLVGTHTYQFDYLNRLASVTSGTDVYSYAYDGDNLRHSKTVNGDTTVFVLDGMDVVADFGGQNDKTYLRGNGLEGYLKDGSNRKFYYNETNGSVYRVYDFNSETNNFNYVSQYFYGGYGNTIWNSWTETSFKFAGEYHDDETGFIYLRNRYYDPSIGRFISEDPAMDGLNWYVYCGNNPVNYVDPWGLDAIIITNKNSVNLGARSAGHTSAIYQNADGNWFYTYWGNKAAAVIRIPDTYVKEWQRNGDVTVNSMNSMSDFNNVLNKFLSAKGFENITSNYTNATYIVGDFTASLDAAYADVNEAATDNFLGIAKGLTSLDDGSLVFQGTNNAYGLLNANCFDKTYASLSKGTLANGVNAGSYMRTLGFEGGLIPNNAISKFSEVFMNSSFTYNGAYSGLSNYAFLYAKNSPWAQNASKAAYANAVVGK